MASALDSLSLSLDDEKALKEEWSGGFYQGLLEEETSTQGF